MAHYLLITGDFVKTGGMDRANHALAEYLADRGDRVELVAHRVAGDLLARPNVAWHRAPKPLGSYLLGGPLVRRLGLRHARRVAGQGGRVVVNGGNCPWPDVNWAHHVHAADAPRPVGGPLRRLKDHAAYRRFVAEEREALRRARLIITGCDRARRDVLDRVGGVRPESVRSVYYGVDSTIFHPASPDDRRALRDRLGWPEGRPKVLFVGALGDARKGFDTLFAAWSSLCRDPSWDADLVVVGRGASVPAWQARAADLGLSDRVSFLGFVADLPGLFRAADAHCLPSRYEGYSLVTQEALACGLPAFVTATAGIAERYPPTLRDLLLPDPDDVPDLSARLRAWRSRMADARSEVAAFSESIRSLTWGGMAARVVGLIEAAG